jgi:hypothetical protein
MENVVAAGLQPSHLVLGADEVAFLGLALSLPDDVAELFFERLHLNLV